MAPKKPSERGDRQEPRANGGVAKAGERQPRRPAKRRDARGYCGICSGGNWDISIPHASSRPKAVRWTQPKASRRLTANWRCCGGRLIRERRWTLNPLTGIMPGGCRFPAHTLMVMRLDGPTEQSVHDLIATSIKVENEGLARRSGAGCPRQIAQRTVWTIRSDHSQSVGNPANEDQAQSRVGQQRVTDRGSIPKKTSPSIAAGTACEIIFRRAISPPARLDFILPASR